jgi:glycosyltransferase involved in cell wall biosynthesis
VKILQFSYTLEPGGAERCVVDLSNELAKNNEVKLYVLRDEKIGNLGFYVPEISEKVTYINLKINKGFKPQLIWAFYKILRTEQPDIVHCHLNLVNYFFLLSFLFYGRIRFVYTIHSDAKAEVTSKIERLIRRFFFKHSLFLAVAISDETKKSFESYYKLKKAKLIINGRKFSGKTVLYEKVLNEVSELKPEPDSLTFCHVAAFCEAKNQKMLISVFNKLRYEGFNVILLIIGDGFEKATDLKALALDHIHFLGLKSNVNDYLYASDAFCLSSVWEGMPISLIEAFACECIPVCTPVGGIVNTIEHGVTGFLSQSVSERDYLETIKQFIKLRKSINKELLSSFYLENLRIEQCAANYMKLYCE